jgi:hypothetical protein
MSVGGIYIAPRNLVAFSVEFLWFAFSGVMLVMINMATTHEPLSSVPVLVQTTALVAIYVSTFYVMDLYDLEVITHWRVLLLNLAQAAGLFCLVVGTFELCTRLFMFDSTLVLGHLMLTAVFAICVRAIIGSASGSTSALLNIVAIGAAPTRQAVEAENRRRRELGIRLHWIAGSLNQATIEINHVLKLNPSVRRVCIDSELLEDPMSIRLLQTCRGRGGKSSTCASLPKASSGKPSSYRASPPAWDHPQSRQYQNSRARHGVSAT